MYDLYINNKLYSFWVVYDPRIPKLSWIIPFVYWNTKFNLVHKEFSYGERDLNKIELIILVIFSGCIISLGYAVGYNMDESFQEHMRYLETCTDGLDGLLYDDKIFCHQYDISMRTTK